MEKLLCAEHTVDQNKDSTNGAIFENGRLYVYLRLNENGSNYSDIVLSGREYMYGVADTGKRRECLYQIHNVERVYSFDNDALEYKEISDTTDLVQTIDGVKSYHDYWSEGVK